MRIDDHPSVRKVRAAQSKKQCPAETVSGAWLRQLCLDHGADDVGFVSIDRSEVAGQKDKILEAYSHTKTLIAIVCKMNRNPVRSPVRSIANMEFHETYDEVNTAAREIVRALDEHGIGSVNAVAAFPQEMQKFPGPVWPVAHKPIAEAAGLGKMGIHRNVIHPRFGNFILLGTILIDRDVDEASEPLDYAPCLECKLCVAVCPVEAIGMDGSFNFSACYAHNYREFMSGFADWVEEIADSDSREDYRERVPLNETVSMWQSLSFKPSYKAAYCISVCPAGEDVLAPFVENKVAFRKEFVEPLQRKEETVYVLPRSDAEDWLAKRFPEKTPKRVRWTLSADDPFSFMFNMTLTFQRSKARGLDACYHVIFPDLGGMKATIAIRKGVLSIEFAEEGDPDVILTTDSTQFAKMFEHSFDLDQAVRDGDLLIEGDLKLVKKLRTCWAVYGSLEGDLEPV